MPAWRIRTVFTGVPGTPWMSNMFFDTGTAGDASTAAGAVYDFWNAVDAYIDANVSWSVDNDVPLFTNPDTLAGWETVVGGSGAGLSSAEMLPRASQVLVQWSTAAVFNNRRVRGRTFVPGLGEGANFDGSVLPALITAVDAAATDLAAAGLVIASRAMNSFVPVTSAAVWDQFAVLRSRRD